MTQTYDHLIVAVDGGGSTCRVSLCHMDGTTLATAQGGAANLTTDLKLAAIAINRTVDQAYINADLSPTRKTQDYSCLGLAGAKLTGVAAQLTKLLDFKDILVTSDQQITIQGAMNGNNGTVASIGTGSFFIAINQGKTRHVGGWGLNLGDECGGANISRAALRKSLHAHDGLIDHTPLTQKIMQHFENSPQVMIIFARNAKPTDYGKFAPWVINAQQKHDPVACEIINDAREFLINTLDNLNTKTIGPLYMLGGLGKIYQQLLPNSYKQICQPPNGNAMAGAIQLAQQKWGI